MASNVVLLANRRNSLFESVAFATGAVAVAGMILFPQAAVIIPIGLLVIALLGVTADVFRGRIDGLLLFWAAVCPLGYYFASFPRQRSIVTLDRVVILALLLTLCFAKPSTFTVIPQSLRRVALASFIFVALAMTTVLRSADPLTSARVLIDAFLFPVLLGWCVIAKLNLRRRLPTLHTAVCISSIISGSIAAAEVVTGRDLLPLPGSDINYAGAIVRPNGPYPSSDALALIGSISIFLLIFLRGELGRKVSGGRRVLHFIGLIAAVGMAVMPLYRSVLLTLLLILVIDTFWEKTPKRLWRIVFILTSLGAMAAVARMAPDTMQDRTDPANFYARVAEYGQSINVIRAQPLVGVGFDNFVNAVQGHPEYAASFQGIASVDSPHSNLAAVLAETGLLGFLPYLIMNLLLIRAFWQLRLYSRAGRRVWRYAVYMLLAYWISGLTLVAGYDSSLNLWFVFAMALMYKSVLTSPDAAPDPAPQLDKFRSRLAWSNR
jgi:O-antigen ligase